MTTDAGWETTETVQLVPADLSLEDILRIWDALGPKYRLSISYIARVVRIDRTVATGLPVVATRFTLSGWSCLMRESVDRRVLGAIRCVDEITGNSVLNAFPSPVPQLTLRPNRSAIYVIFNAPGLAAKPHSLIRPRLGRMLRRSRSRFKTRIGGICHVGQNIGSAKAAAAVDPSQPFDPAKVLSDPVVVFNPQPVPLFPSPASPCLAELGSDPHFGRSQWSCSAEGFAVGQWYRFRATDNKAYWRPQGGRPGRGVACHPRTGPGDERQRHGSGNLSERDVTITSWFDPGMRNQSPGWIPNPDDILNNLASASLKTGTLTTQVGPGQTLNRSLAISV